jgi:hypothetical protein
MQQKVAKAMADRAEASAPDYVLNAGGNFHKMGISAHCGSFDTPADTHQWADIYEDIYVGGLADVQWLGVLGSVDYGGSTFAAGWDQQIAYTWERPPPWSGRWMLPAQYYSTRVLYDDFTVEYFFVDSNRWSAYPKELDPEHNVCGELHAQDLGPATCATTGPASLDDCEAWFESLWSQEMDWLKEALDGSTADWQVVVTHFQGDAIWGSLAGDYGIDLLIMGQQPFQEVLYLDDTNSLRPTGVINAGGGGGVISQQAPDPGGHDFQYGFVDLTLSKDLIKIELVSHGGVVVDSASVRPRAPGEQYDPDKDYSSPSGGADSSKKPKSSPTSTTARASTTAGEDLDAVWGGQYDEDSKAEEGGGAGSEDYVPKGSSGGLVEELGQDGFEASLEVSPSTPQTRKDTVVFAFVAENVDYQALASNTKVKDSLVKGLKQAVAEETKVSAEGVAIELSQGSLAVRAVIQPGDRSASDVRVALAGSESFGESLTRCFHELRGIDSVSTGTIRIRPAGAPTIVKAPPPASAASWTDGDLAPGLPKRAVWAGCAGACAAVLVTAMVCAVLKLRSEDTTRLPVSMQDEPRDAGKSPLLDSRPVPCRRGTPR